jgi:hypothetical protein
VWCDRVNVIDVDLAQPGVSLKPVQQQGSTYETVTAMRSTSIAGAPVLREAQRAAVRGGLRSSRRADVRAVLEADDKPGRPSIAPGAGERSRLRDGTSD